jgi:hypothetical protein
MHPTHKILFLTACIDYETVRASAQRSQPLRSYVEPTEEAREHELNIPTAAHRAIADRIAGGRSGSWSIPPWPCLPCSPAAEALVEQWAGVVVSDGDACTDTGCRADRCAWPTRRGGREGRQSVRIRKPPILGDACWQNWDLKAVIPLNTYAQWWSAGLRCTIPRRASDGRVEQCGVAAGLARQWD